MGVRPARTQADASGQNARLCPGKIRWLMLESDAQRLVRLAAFNFLDEQTRLIGEVLPIDVLRGGFTYDGDRIPLMGPQGIFKPARLDLPISVTSVPIVAGRDRPYEDDV